MEEEFLEYPSGPIMEFVGLHETPMEVFKTIDPGYSCGWKCLDRYLHGIRTSEVTVVTADTGVGKTTFVTNLIVNLARQGVVGWVNSWEMKPATTIRKIASIVLQKPMKMVDFSDEDLIGLAQWSKEHPIYINHSTLGVDIAMLGRSLVKAANKGVKVVMLDHLDYLVNSRKENLHEAISEAVRRLHELACTLDMHFFLICHPKQVSNAAEEIGLHSLRGSSAIKQYADNVLVLHRCTRTDQSSVAGKTKVTVAKNRCFGVEGVTFLWYQPWDGYQELQR